MRQWVLGHIAVRETRFPGKIMQRKIKEGGGTPRYQDKDEEDAHANDLQVFCVFIS